MLIFNLDILRIMAGGVLSTEGTNVVRVFSKMLCALDTVQGNKNVYTSDVFAEASKKLHELGEKDLAALVDEASNNTKALTYAAMSAYAATVIVAEMERAGKTPGETLSVLQALQKA